jgi:amidophosphoribosyltransferase
MREFAQIEGKPRCHCAVFGIIGNPEASMMAYYGLHAQQHRGQEASGIVTRQFLPEKNRWKFNVHRDNGLVMDVFRDDELLKSELAGTAAIGHNRYSTTGSAANKYNIQPFVVNYKGGNMALCHNGNLTNFHELRARLEGEGTIFQSTSDSELFLHLIARSKKSSQIEQIKEALSMVEGAYSLAILSDHGLIAARDPYGFRPLAVGRLDRAFVVASETCAFDIIGAEYLGDVKPGEILVFDDEAIETGIPKSYRISKDNPQTFHCIFEYIYFSRPDSRVFGENVDKVRRKLGKLLAQQARVDPKSPDEKVIVISVPDSSNTATLGFVSESNKLGSNVRSEIGLIRSHYVGRTFIQPEQKHRELKVKTKFNTVKGVLKDRTVVMIDDSIVRGTTSQQLIKLIRDAGAKEVHFRVTSPPIKFSCHYGMDFPSRDELVANRCHGSVEEIRNHLNVDSLEYLSLENLLQAVPHDNNKNYCTACFTGEYPTTLNEQQEKDVNDL